MLIRTLFSILILLTALDSASAQKFELDKGDTINRRDASDFKQGWWKIFNRERGNLKAMPKVKWLKKEIM
jgi:hypothetical protein